MALLENEATKFSEIPSKDIPQLFAPIFRKPAPGIAWIEGHMAAVSTKMTSFQDIAGIFIITIQEQADEAAFIKKLSEQSTQECFFNINLPNAVLFFRAQYKPNRPPGYHFKITGSIYQVQRRRHPRLPVSETVTLNAVVTHKRLLEIGKNELPVRILDISAGGAALLLNDIEASYFDLGITLDEFKFSLKDRTIQCQAVVRHKQKLQFGIHNKKIKVGIEFINLKQQDQTFLSAYIFESSSQYLGRL